MTWPRWWSVRPSPAPGLDPDSIEEVILGNANGAGEENRNVARMATLLAGLPLHIPGITVNRLCASGLSAIIQASHMIKSGAADVVIAGGVESMSRAPWVQEKPATAFAKPGQIFDTSIGWRFANPKFQKGDLARDGKMTYSMPETAEELARVDSIPREERTPSRSGPMSGPSPPSRGPVHGRNRSGYGQDPQGRNRGGHR